jgi:hypothetical protein
MFKKILILSSVVVLFVLATSVFAANTMPDTYIFEVGIPGVVAKNESLNVVGLPTLILKVISLLYIIGAIIAFISLIFAGFQYMSSQGNMSKTRDAMDRVSKAFIGLFILLGAYLILYTINPDLVMLPNQIFVSPNAAFNQLDNPMDPLKGYETSNYETFTYSDTYNEQDTYTANAIIETMLNNTTDIGGDSTASVIDDLENKRLDPQLLAVLKYVLGLAVDKTVKPAVCGRIIVGPIMRAEPVGSCHNVGKAFDIEIIGQGNDEEEREKNMQTCHK